MTSEVYLGDCMDFMTTLPDKFFQLAIVDPPYGIRRDEGFEGFEGFGGFGKPIARKKYKGKWDDKRPDKIYFDELLRVSKKVIIWGGNFFADLLPFGNHWIVWNKLNTMPTFGDCELAYTNIERDSVKMVTIQFNGLIGKETTRIHPTQKPIALYRWLLKNYAKPGEKIFDSQMGSQSSRIAAYQMGFDYWGCELDPDYFRDGCKRFDAVIHKRDTEICEPAPPESGKLF